MKLIFFAFLCALAAIPLASSAQETVPDRRNTTCCGQWSVSLGDCRTRDHSRQSTDRRLQSLYALRAL